MSILVNSTTKAIVQGFTGSEGTFHSEQMLAYGTKIVGGVTPGKGGYMHLECPVFDTVLDAKNATDATASILFVPPAFAADAIMEAVDAEMELVICITEGIPVQDMLSVKEFIRKRNNRTRLIGPNCPGVITPDECKLGIMPGFVFKKGKVGIVSKSGTLTYEASDQVVKAGLGVSTAIGIGGDPIIGTSVKEATELFMDDDDTDVIVLIGEIGGSMEVDAAKWIKENHKKPVVGFIAGQTAPPGRRMGHAGAIVGGSDDTAAAKMKVMRECGFHVVESPADIGKAVRTLVEK